jgi:4-alpha-glucanotransferase
MRFTAKDHYLSGVSLPVSALRSEDSCGTGDFHDLIALGEWCVAAGLDLIQVLPVNDTGSEASPYSALSAYALHPLYIRLDALPEASEFADDIREVRERFEQESRLRYHDVRAAKLKVLRRMFQHHASAIRKDADLALWVAESEWIREYAAYLLLKQEHDGRAWFEWSRLRDPEPDDIHAYWEEHRDDALFHAWLQWRLHQQLQFVGEQLKALGVALKGDLPILMNPDSTDVWAHRELFRLDLRAGAPPDMFSALGQNWDFPVYDWDALRADDFAWWKRRLRQAALFYHAYRIDHVLGFFRIWAIPERNLSGSMGYYLPSYAFAAEELQQLGFDEGRLRWLSVPHVPGDELRARLGTEADTATDAVLQKIEGEDLYNFRDEIRGEKDVLALGLSDETTGVLLEWYRDRALILTHDGDYVPAWHHRDSRSFSSLSDAERATFEDLVHIYYHNSERVWERTGRDLLSFMKETTNMLVCAEDLGTVPACVPKVLEQLGILGLRIPRWTKRYDAPREPFVPLVEYPKLSVCAPSVHDTSTLRGWWNSEEDRKEDACLAFDLSDGCPKELTPDTVDRFIRAFARTSSLLCIFQIQDLFSLDSTLVPQDPRLERINVPGTVSPDNWTYRMPVTIHDLDRQTEVATRVSELLSERRRRPATSP